MTDNQHDNAVPNDESGIQENIPFSVGVALREARTHLNLSVTDVSHHIKFAPRQIEALEADDFDHLPETAFLRGFVRSYARLVQLDSAPLLAALPRPPEQPVTQDEKVQNEAPYPNIITERKQNIAWLAAALVIAIALALVAWFLGDNQKEPAIQKDTVTDIQKPAAETLVQPNPVPVSEVPQVMPVSEVHAIESVSGVSTSSKPLADRLDTETKKIADLKTLPSVVAPPAKPAAVPVVNPVINSPDANKTQGKSSLRMTFDEDSWVEVRGQNGKYLLSQVNHAGSELIVNGEPPFTLVVGNSKAVHLYYKGQPVDLAQHTKVTVARLTLE
jgi:cytoskeleton protein RodZ